MRLAIIALAICLVTLFSQGSAAAGGKGSDLRITQLDCNSNPEVVTLMNFGSSQNLGGWELRSDPITNAGQVFDLSLVGSLDPGEQVSILSGSNAPETDPASGQYRWALSFKLRNDDPTDFVQIVNSSSISVDQLNCGDEPPPPPLDSDGDGVSDAIDNCPAWPNPDQSLPPWPIPADDPDCDGFSTADENFIGTAPNLACGPNAWPPDHNSDGLISISDVLLMKAAFGAKTPDDPIYDARRDLNADGKISISDVLMMRDFFDETCITPLPPTGSLGDLDSRSEVPPSQPGSGDVNGDGFLSITDALLVTQHIVGLTSVDPDVADVNGDGRVGGADPLLIAQIVIGLI